ncbi:hypothetical protein BD769DRAFT_1502615 [Suillus cothurnatus]|nr:hypothetical protein BD769DRAFT_1502615 [Suillus cothurnatus]
MLSTLFVVTVTWSVVASTAIVTTSPTAITTLGCYQTSGSISFFIPSTLLFVFQLVLVSLTLVCVIQSWRSAKGPLYVILARHNIFYYACGLLLPTVSVLMPVVRLSDVRQ